MLSDLMVQDDPGDTEDNDVQKYAIDKGMHILLP
jgi:hypothetical protein